MRGREVTESTRPSLKSTTTWMREWQWLGHPVHEVRIIWSNCAITRQKRWVRVPLVAIAAPSITATTEMARKRRPSTTNTTARVERPDSGPRNQDESPTRSATRLCRICQARPVRAVCDTYLQMNRAVGRLQHEQLKIDSSTVTFL